MDSFIQVQRKLLLRLDSRSKGLLPLFHLVRGLFGAELVVDDLECASFFDGAIGGGAVWAVHDFARHGVDSFGEGLTLHVFEVGPPKALDVRTAICFFEEYASTGLVRCSKEGRQQDKQDVIGYCGSRTLHIH